MPDVSQSEEEPDYSVNTLNEFAINAGQNLPNHSTSMAGRGKFVRVGDPKPVIFRTQQEAFRFCAWVLTLADTLPSEAGGHSFETVLDAIQST